MGGMYFENSGVKGKFGVTRHRRYCWSIDALI